MSTHTFPVINQTFEVERKYKFIRELGHGAYGVVCSAKNEETGTDVAIKKISKVFEKKIIAKRTLRELKLLRHFNGHENIISIIDVPMPRSANFDEIYVIQQLMEADLHQIIRSGQSLSDAHFQYFIYQILRGLKYMHSANVLHRDLKPGNLLVNSDCELKICDFGLARGFSEKAEDMAGFMTEYVVTRWYRAPEIMLSYQTYTKAIDVWSVGCIFAELLGGKVLFPGKDYINQLNLILGVLGTPSNEEISRIGSQRAQDYIRKLPKMPKVPFSRLYPHASSKALDLLEKMLTFDPSRRITTEEALAHPYLAQYHDASDEPTTSKFDFSFESAQTIPEIRQKIVEEVQAFHLAKQPRPQRRPSLLQMPQNKANNDPGALSAADVIPQPLSTIEADPELEKDLEQGVKG